MREIPLSSLPADPRLVAVCVDEWNAMTQWYWESGLYQEAWDWLRDRGMAHDDIWCVAFYVLDAPFAAIHRWDRSKAGHTYVNEYGKPAVAEPVIVLLDELPPPQLFGLEREASFSRSPWSGPLAY